jgi:drug/metabolite transporter (DMT)-like permease
LSISQTAGVILCVLTISVGQLLFKRAGIEVQSAGSWFTLRVFFYVVVAFAIYGAATVFWIHLLRSISLNQGYFFFALSFVFVPIASHYLFNDALTMKHFVGAGLIALGIFITVQGGA